jgi:hemerythrin-like domain-containing protein
MSEQHSEQQDVIGILTTDHREVEEMFRELEALMAAGPSADQDRRRHLVDRVTVELVRHAVAEEVAVYPAVKDKVSAEEAERAKQEHAEAERTLKRLERLDPDDASFDAEIRTLMTEIRAHVVEEEGEMFPHMRQVMTQEELVGLGKKVQTIKKLAPTRPHPHVPNEPGVRAALGPVAGLFDRLRDLATGRAKDD